MKNIILTLLLTICLPKLIAQDTISIKLSKGQVLDVLPLKFNPKADPQSLRKYLSESVLPRALELGYIPLKAFPLKKGGAIQGNYTPDQIILGAWSDKASLEKNMAQLEEEFPDFHALRREIWTVFYNTHYKLKEDLNFTFLPNKFYVATSYWKKQDINFDKLLKLTGQHIDKYKGRLILGLLEGDSPYGYYYNPDYFFISEWDQENDFLEFMKQHQSHEKLNLKHINQFILDLR